MTLTERERIAVEEAVKRGCIMCSRIVESWLINQPTADPSVTHYILRDWRDGVVTFDVQAQKFHVECEVRTENARGMREAKS